MSIRIIIKIFLTIQLLLLIFRQMIDFAGIQWLMIIINAIAIIITITGFFGYLMLYASFQILLILYNIYVICVYARFITINNNNTSGNILSQDFIASSPQSLYSYKGEQFHNQNDVGGEQGLDSYPPSIDVHTSPLLPSAQLLSFDSNSRSFWYVIVSNHISNIQSHLNHYMNAQSSSSSSSSSSVAIHKHSSHHHHLVHRHHPLDDSLVDVCVQYIEICIASIHILFSLLAIGLILLKHKLERDKFFRNNDKTTPPLPPYTINPQMNHYMSFTPMSMSNKSIGGTTNSGGGGSLYNQISSTRRSSKRRRSTRSLHNQKSKSNSLGALNHIRANSSGGSLRSISSKKHQHRKSASSLLMMNNNNNNHDTSFSNNTIGSHKSIGNKSLQQHHHSPSNDLYGTILSPVAPQPPPPPQPISNNKSSLVPIRHNHYHSRQMANQRHSHYGQLPYVNNNLTAQRVAKFLNSDSETDNYYHTFSPIINGATSSTSSYLNNGLANPLYGKRNSYLDSSETAI